MKGIFRQEWLLFIRNKKNLICIFTLIALTCFYSINSIQDINKTVSIVKQNTKNYLNMQDKIYGELIGKTKANENELDPQTKFYLKNYKQLKETYNYLLNDNITGYTAAISAQNDIFIEGLHQRFLVPAKHYIENSSIPLEHSIHDYTIERETAKAIANYEKVNYSVVFNKTSIQKTVDLMKSGFVFIFILLLIIFSSGIVSQMLHAKSIHAGIPISLYKQLFFKSSFIISISFIISFASLFGVFLINSWKNGSGTYYIPMAIFRDNKYIIINCGYFLIMVIILMALLGWFFVRFVFLMELIVKNQYITLFIMIVLMLSNTILEKIMFIPLKLYSYFPTSYVDIGRVVTGEKAFLYYDEITTSKGVFAYVCSIILIEVLHLLFSDIQNRKGELL